MITKLDGGKEVVRELAITVQDVGARELIVTVRGDGVMYLRAKGMRRHVVWKLEALYEKVLKRGEVSDGYDARGNAGMTRAVDIAMAIAESESEEGNDSYGVGWQIADRILKARNGE